MPFTCKRSSGLVHGVAWHNLEIASALVGPIPFKAEEISSADAVFTLTGLAKTVMVKYSWRLPKPFFVNSFFSVRV